MDRNDQKAIEDLFDRLAAAMGRAPAPDAESKAYIEQHIAAMPSAPYYMAQTIVAQERALKTAEAKIDELQALAMEPGGRVYPRAGQPLQPGGGFLANAAQTALGVTGGVLLGEALAGLFGRGHEAEAAEHHHEHQPDQDHQQDQGLQPERHEADHAADLHDASYDESDSDGGSFDDSDFDDGGFGSDFDI